MQKLRKPTNVFAIEIDKVSHTEKIELIILIKNGSVNIDHQVSMRLRIC